MTDQQSHLIAKLRTVDSATVGQMTDWLRTEFADTDASLVIGMAMHAGQLRRINGVSVSWALVRENVL